MYNPTFLSLRSSLDRTELEIVRGIKYSLLVDIAYGYYASSTGKESKLVDGDLYFRMFPRTYKALSCEYVIP